MTTDSWQEIEAEYRKWRELVDEAADEIEDLLDDPARKPSNDEEKLRKFVQYIRNS